MNDPDIASASETEIESKVSSSVLDAFGLLKYTQNDVGKHIGGFKIISQLQGNENKKEVDFVLRMLMRGLGANVPEERTGYFESLVVMLTKVDTITVTQLLGLVKKELHANRSSKSEVGDVALGQILLCGAIFRSKLILKCSTEEQPEIIKLLLNASKKNSYLSSVAYMMLLDFANALEEEQFSSILWPNIKKELKKELKEHTLDSLYFIMMIHKKYPGKVKLKKLLGIREILHEDNIQVLCEKLLNGVDFSAVNHPIYKEIGTQIATSPHLKEFWTTIDSQLVKHNRYRELVALNILTNILNNIQDYEIIPELLSKNFFKLFMDWFKAASKISSKRNDEDDKPIIKKQQEVLNTLANALKSDKVDSKVRVEVLKKLLFDPGEVNFTEITGTAIVKSMIADLDKDGVKKMAKLLKGVLLNTSQKTVKDATRNWYNNERAKAAELLSYLVSHEAVKDNKKEVDFVLRMLVRGLGANVPEERTGYFESLVVMLTKVDTITVTQLLGLVKKELHANRSSKSEVDVALGQILLCGAIFRSKLILKCSTEEQPEIIKLLLNASKKNSYLSSVAYMMLLDFANALEEEQFSSILWPNIKKELKKELKEHTLDSLYFIMMIHKKYPGKVKLKKLLGIREILHEDNIQVLCEKLLNGVDFSAVNHPIYKEIGTQIATSPHLKEFWTTIDSQLVKHNRYRELVALNILTNILNNIQDYEIIPELLSKNFFKLFMDWFKAASKISSKRNDEDDKPIIKKQQEVLNTLANALKSDKVDSKVRVEVLKKLLFDPGEVNFTEITGTAIVKSMIADLDKDGVKKMAKLLKGVLLNTSQKTVKDATRNWYNNERAKAAELLSYLVSHEAVKDNKKEVDFVLRMLVRGLGANVPEERTGYFESLVVMLTKVDTITVTQLLGLVKKELHANRSSKSEVDVALGQILLCGAIFRSKLILKCSTEEQPEIIKLLLNASKKNSYLSSVAYMMLLDFANALEEEQFSSILWPNIKKELKKELKEHTLDSLYFIMMIHKKYPGKVKLKKLLGIREILHEDNIQVLCEKLLNGVDFSAVNHPIYKEIGTQIATSPHLKEFWTTIDSQLVKHNRYRELVALNILTNILNNIQDYEIIPELLSKNFFKLFMDWFKAASKISSKRNDEDDKPIIKKQQEVLNTLANALKSDKVDSKVRVEVLKKLLFDPGEVNFTEITGTAIVKSMIADLDKDGVKKMAKLLKGVLLNTSQKTVKDATRNWYNNERAKAAELLSYLVSHEAVKDNTEFKFTYMKLLMCFGFFKIGGDENVAFSSSGFAESIKACFYRCFTSKFFNVDSLVTVLSSLCNFICSILDKEEVRKKLEKQFPKENVECWDTLMEVCRKIEETDSKTKVDKAFLILLYQLGLFLFSEPAHVEIARSSIKELKSCYKHYKKGTKKSKLKTEELSEEPEWIEVLVEVLLSILSAESTVLRSIVQCVFRLLWEYLPPSSVGQIVSVLDPDSESNPLTQDSDDEDNDESDDETKDVEGQNKKAKKNKNKKRKLEQVNGNTEKQKKRIRKDSNLSE